MSMGTGSISARTRGETAKNPVPRGPRRNLRPVAEMKSAPISVRSTGICPNDWHASSRYQAFESAARSTRPISVASAVTPFWLAAWVIATTFTRASSISPSAAGSTDPSGPSGMNSTVAPTRRADCSIGRTLLAYSARVVKIRSPLSSGTLAKALNHAAVADGMSAICSASTPTSFPALAGTCASRSASSSAAAYPPTRCSRSR